MPALTLDLLPERFTVCRLPADAEIPAWATARPFFTVTRTRDELSVMCHEDLVPAGITTSRAWRVLMLRGPFDFALVGILLSVAAPLAEAGVSIMPVATYDTDYVLVREEQLPLALDTLRRAGHVVPANEEPTIA